MLFILCKEKIEEIQKNWGIDKLKNSSKFEDTYLAIALLSECEDFTKKEIIDFIKTSILNNEERKIHQDLLNFFCSN